MEKIFKNEFTQLAWERVTEESGISYDLFNSKEIEEIEVGVDKYIEFNGCYWKYGFDLEDYLYQSAYDKEVIQPIIASNKQTMEAIAYDNKINMGHF